MTRRSVSAGSGLALIRSRSSQELVNTNNRHDESKEEQHEIEARAGELHKNAKIAFVISVPVGSIDLTSPWEGEQLAAIAQMFNRFFENGQVSEFLLLIAGELQWYNLRMNPGNKELSDKALQERAIQAGIQWWERNKEKFENQPFWERCKITVSHWHYEEWQEVLKAHLWKVEQYYNEKPSFKKAVEAQSLNYLTRKKNIETTDKNLQLAQEYVKTETAVYRHLTQRIDCLFYPGGRPQAFEWIRNEIVPKNKGKKNERKGHWAEWRNIQIKPQPTVHSVLDSRAKSRDAFAKNIDALFLCFPEIIAKMKQCGLSTEGVQKLIHWLQMVQETTRALALPLPPSPSVENCQATFYAAVKEKKEDEPTKGKHRRPESAPPLLSPHSPPSGPSMSRAM